MDEEILEAFKEVLEMWTLTYASDMCDQRDVAFAYQKLYQEGGTLAYIAKQNEKIRMWTKKAGESNGT